MPAHTPSTRSVILIILAVIATFGAAAYGLGVMNMKNEAPETEEKAETPSAPQLDTALLATTADDLVIGKAEAPVTIVEYSSLSCPHCAHFHKDILPKLQKDYIDTGKVKLVLRHFPLNASALKGAMLVDCVGGQERAQFVKVLFEMQDKWAFSPSFEDALKQIAGVGGVDAETFDRCMKDKAKEDALIAKTEEASAKLGINGTPSFFINQVKYSDDLDLESFSAAVEKAVAK